MVVSLRGLFLGNYLGTQAYLGWGPIFSNIVSGHKKKGKPRDQRETTWTWASLQEVTKWNKDYLKEKYEFY